MTPLTITKNNILYIYCFPHVLNAHVFFASLIAIVFGTYFKYFWPCNFKKLYLCCYLQFHIELYLIRKGKNLTFRKKYFGLRKPIIFRKKKLQGIFLHNYFKTLLKNVTLPGELSILCNAVKTIFFLQYLSKTAQKIGWKYIATSDFLEIYFLTLSHYAMTSELISIMALDTWWMLTFERRFIF